MNIQNFVWAKPPRHSPTGTEHAALPSSYVCKSPTFPHIQINIIIELIYIFTHMYLYIILLRNHFLFLYYSDLSRNYLNGTIPKQWGSMMNISKMYDLSLIFLFWFLIIVCLVYYRMSILMFGSYFSFLRGFCLHSSR